MALLQYTAADLHTVLYDPVCDIVRHAGHKTMHVDPGQTLTSTTPYQYKPCGLQLVIHQRAPDRKLTTVCLPVKAIDVSLKHSHMIIF